MADFTSGFWDGYIAVITLISILACAVLLKAMSVHKVQTGAGSGTAGQATTGHVWDEDLGEYNNPLPRWWIWLFYITIVFSLAYLVVYPGLGSYAGLWKWTSAGEYAQEMKQAEADYGPIFARFASQDLKAVATDPEARSIGQKLFLNNCAQCHASDAGGSKGFPNLTDRDWLWGGEPEAIRTSIANGRNGVMPAFGAVLGDEAAKDTAHYVRRLAGLASDSIRVTRGKETFASTCAACHGPDGKGNTQLGAPNLTDGIWLYGSSEATIVETILKGRNNLMPAHKDFLGDAKVHLLAAYVWGLSNAPAPAREAGK